MQFAGESAGVAASFTWAVSSLVYSRIPAPADAINLYKNTVASVLFVLTLAGRALLEGRGIPVPGSTPLILLFLSGFLGIFVGDSFYFRSLQILGARRGLVLTTLAPPFGGFLGWIVFGQTLSGLASVGMALTLVGIGTVVSDPSLEGDAPGHANGSRARGVVYGFLGALCQAGQFALSTMAMERGVDPLEASTLRLLSAALLGAVAGLATGRLGQWRRAVLTRSIAPRLAAAGACGTYAGIWLSLIASSLTPLAVATTLTALSPIFVLPLARIFLYLRMSPRALLGALVALVGVTLLFRRGSW